MAEKPEDKKGEVVPLRPTRPCPICSKPSVRAHYPFCSQRCADVDLNRWLSGSYSIPVSEEDEERSSEPDEEGEGDT